MSPTGPILFGLAAMLAVMPARAAVGANGFEDLTLLDQRVVGALDAEIGTPGGPVTHIDSRLKLQPCPTPAVIDPPAMGAVAIRCPAVGWRIRVPLTKVPSQIAPVAATVVAAAPLGPVVIKRGDPVELSAGDNGFIVSTQAVAQEDGHVGGIVRVKTDPRGPIILGHVADNGRVQVARF